MDDKLEKYIKNHRAEFDSEVPDADVWQGINQAIVQKDSKARRLKPLVIWRAAAVILLLVCIALLAEKLQPDHARQTATVAMSARMNEAENFYSTMIHQKSSAVKLKAKKYHLEGSFLEDLDRLDSAYQVLKNDLSVGNEENVEDAMVLNLQLRMEILNRQLDIIKSMENFEKNEGISL